MPFLLKRPKCMKYGWKYEELLTGCGHFSAKKKYMGKINNNYLFIYGRIHMFFHAVVMSMKSKSVLSGGRGRYN